MSAASDLEEFETNAVHADSVAESVDEEMTAADWVGAGAEVLADYGATDPKSLVMRALVDRGVREVVEALRDAADAASDHIGDGNGCMPADAETVRKLDRFRAAMREAVEALS